MSDRQTRGNRFSPEFRGEVVAHHHESGGSIAATARKYDVPPSTVRRWLGAAEPSRAAVADEKTERHVAAHEGLTADRAAAGGAQEQATDPPLPSDPPLTWERGWHGALGRDPFESFGRMLDESGAEAVRSRMLALYSEAGGRSREELENRIEPLERRLSSFPRAAGRAVATLAGDRERVERRMVSAIDEIAELEEGLKLTKDQAQRDRDEAAIVDANRQLQDLVAKAAEYDATEQTWKRRPNHPANWLRERPERVETVAHLYAARRELQALATRERIAARRGREQDANRMASERRSSVANGSARRSEVDLLADRRRFLGARAEVLERQARMLMSDMAKKPAHELEAIYEREADIWATFDRPAAYAVRRIESDREIATEALAVSKSTGDLRREREATTRLERLNAEEQRLWNRHPDRFFAKHGPAAAEVLAAKRVALERGLIPAEIEQPPREGGLDHGRHRVPEPTGPRVEPGGLEM